jgi:outer membrane immunogenic protein
LGYLVAPTVYSYLNGGYSGANWNGTGLVSSFTGAASGVHTNSFTQNGWFIGGGVENKLALFGFLGPNWFVKTEYRAHPHYQRAVRRERRAGTQQHYLQASGADDQHLAGLSLQLGRPGDLPLLISV